MSDSQHQAAQALSPQDAPEAQRTLESADQNQAATAASPAAEASAPAASTEH